MNRKNNICHKVENVLELRLNPAAHLWIQLLKGDAAGGEEEDGGEGGDAGEQAEERGPQRRPRCLPPLLDVGDVEDAGRRPLSLAEHLAGHKTPDSAVIFQHFRVINVLTKFMSEDVSDFALIFLCCWFSVMQRLQNTVIEYKESHRTCVSFNPKCLS